MKRKEDSVFRGSPVISLIVISILLKNYKFNFTLQMKQSNFMGFKCTKRVLYLTNPIVNLTLTPNLIL